MDSVSSRFFLFKTVAGALFSEISVFLLVPSLIAFATKFPAAFDNQETGTFINVLIKTDTFTFNPVWFCNV
jgi:hypothetical protein